jgi:hypothetical protein
MYIGHMMFDKYLQGPENASMQLKIWSLNLWYRWFPLSIPYLQRGKLDGCLLVFDLTKRYSLYQCTVEALTRWKGVLQRELVDKESSLELVNIPIPIILVGTKFDLEDYREVSREEMQAFVKKHNLNGCIEVSAKTGYNVDEAMNMLIYHMLMARGIRGEDQKDAGRGTE